MTETLATTTRILTVKTAGKPHDPIQEINSPAFLKALLGGAPAAPRAFRALVKAMHPQLARFVGRWFRDQDQIQDVLQETFLAVHRALPRFEGKSKLTTWVYSLAHHKVCDKLSEKYRAGRGQAEDGDHAWDLESPDPGPDEALHQARLVEWIRAAAEILPPMYREAYRLRDLEGLSGDEAAAALAISPTLIRVRLHRARALIVERLQKTHPGLFAEGIFASAKFRRAA
jgi:RNA polymerase sigma-70 factor, ECF subfamily